jgi:hypothetical protein
MKAVLGVVVAFGVAASISAAAPRTPVEQTWKGTISDSNCNGKHSAEEHGKKLSATDCTQMCVKKGAKYVFVSDGKVFQLANQSSKQIAAHAGQEVELTGELKGNTITAKTLKGPGGK